MIEEAGKIGDNWQTLTWEKYTLNYSQRDFQRHSNSEAVYLSGNSDVEVGCDDQNFRK
jgi:hypothetical protein